MRAVSRLPILIIAVCAALAIAGCGSSSDSSSTGSTGAAATNAESTTTKSNAGSEGSGSQKSKVQEESGVELLEPGVPKAKGPPPKQLVSKEIIPGVGVVAKDGDEVTVQYVGVDYKTGKKFDASWDRNEPFSFRLGAGEVIPGWDQGVVGMKVNGRRELTIPPNLAYGSAGSPPAIPPNETLIFMIDLVSVN